MSSIPTTPSTSPHSPSTASFSRPRPAPCPSQPPGYSSEPASSLSPSQQQLANCGLTESHSSASANAKQPAPFSKPAVLFIRSTALLAVRRYCGGGFGVTEIGFGGSGGFGVVNPGITGVCPITPAAALTILIPYRSSVSARSCISNALSSAYAAVPEIRLLSAVAR